MIVSSVIKLRKKQCSKPLGNARFLPQDNFLDHRGQVDRKLDHDHKKISESGPEGP